MVVNACVVPRPDIIAIHINAISTWDEEEFSRDAGTWSESKPSTGIMTVTVVGTIVLSCVIVCGRSEIAVCHGLVKVPAS